MHQVMRCQGLQVPYKARVDGGVGSPNGTNRSIYISACYCKHLPKSESLAYRCRWNCLAEVYKYFIVSTNSRGKKELVCALTGPKKLCGGPVMMCEPSLILTNSGPRKVTGRRKPESNLVECRRGRETKAILSIHKEGSPSGPKILHV